MMTKVGPLLLVLGKVETATGEAELLTITLLVLLLLLVELIELEVVDDEEALSAGVGLGDDLNLLSRIESNSANCSMVLEDMTADLTTGCFIVWPKVLVVKVIMELVVDAEEGC